MRLTVQTTSGSSSGSPGAQNAYTVANWSWSETTMTYANAPALGTKVIGSVPGGSAARTAYTVTLTQADLQSAVGGQLTLAITGPQPTLLCELQGGHGWTPGCAGTGPGGGHAKRGHSRCCDPVSKNVRRRPTLPPGPPGSTIGAERLSFRVRNETGRFPFAMTAVTL